MSNYKIDSGHIVYLTTPTDNWLYRIERKNSKMLQLFSLSKNGSIGKHQCFSFMLGSNFGRGVKPFPFQLGDVVRLNTTNYRIMNIYCEERWYGDFRVLADLDGVDAIGNITVDIAILFKGTYYDS